MTVVNEQGRIDRDEAECDKLGTTTIGALAWIVHASVAVICSCVITNIWLAVLAAVLISVVIEIVAVISLGIALMHNPRLLADLGEKMQALGDWATDTWNQVRLSCTPA